MPSTGTTVFVTFALLCFGIGLNALDLPEEWADVSAEILKANPARGHVTCSSGGLQYIITRSDAVALVLTNPGSIVANISKLHIGPNANDLECQAQPTPKNYPTAVAATVSYEKCGIVRQIVDIPDFGPMLTFTARVSGIVRVPTNNPNIFKNLRFALPATCSTPVGQPLAVPVENMDYIQEVMPVEGGFDVDITVLTSSEVKPFLVYSNIQVVTLNFSIDQNFREDYKLFVDSCWMGFSENKTAEPIIPYINKHGCDETGGDVMLPKANLEDYEAVYEVAVSDYEDRNSETFWFHCEINTCYRKGSAAELARCEPQGCTASGNKAKTLAGVTDNVNFYGHSTSIAVVRPTGNRLKYTKGKFVKV